jgi:hypothetical protein
MRDAGKPYTPASLPRGSSHVRPSKYCLCTKYYFGWVHLPGIVNASRAGMNYTHQKYKKCFKTWEYIEKYTFEVKTIKQVHTKIPM